ncbi:hypothetical protein LX59_03082 [Azomonas agilis]|uniref:Uncharacterized protein n=1 Tax=Azomonas agilis TaxID=116849 RepID=A0A562HYL3_9GAMM|nr:hypothetical protein [Azomonas agilis]TWH63831.1 hypothetical protein LX59_03082 [Azomonas agilis]
MVKARVDSLPQDKRAKAAVKCWSALKNTFGCTYKKIDPNQFTDAVSLVARLELEGEFLGKDDQPKLEPFAQIIGRPLKPIERWIVYTDGSDKEQYRPIPIDSFVMTPAKLLYVMANTPDAPIPTQDLFDFVVAALSKLKAIRSARAVPQEVFNEGAKMVAQRFLEGDFLGKEPKPKPITLNQLDLAMLYTFSSAAMQLCDMGERMKPAIEALRPMGLFGVNARLESCRLAVSHFYKQMGPQMEAAAQKEKLLNEWMDLGAAEDRSRPIIRG